MYCHPAPPGAHRVGAEHLGISIRSFLIPHPNYFGSLTAPLPPASWEGPGGGWHTAGVPSARPSAATHGMYTVVRFASAWADCIWTVYACVWTVYTVCVLHDATWTIYALYIDWMAQASGTTFRPLTWDVYRGVHGLRVGCINKYTDCSASVCASACGRLLAYGLPQKRFSSGEGRLTRREPARTS